MSAAWDLVYGSTLWFAFGGCEEGMRRGGLIHQCLFHAARLEAHLGWGNMSGRGRKQ